MVSTLTFNFLQKISLADMETALVRNLTDHMGNNLLHIVCRQVNCHHFCMPLSHSSVAYVPFIYDYGHMGNNLLHIVCRQVNFHHIHFIIHFTRYICGIMCTYIFSHISPSISHYSTSFTHRPFRGVSMYHLKWWHACLHIFNLCTFCTEHETKDPIKKVQRINL